jgi:hypothetical protein
MERLYITTYRLRDKPDGNDLSTLTARLPGSVAGAGIIAHYRRLDGTGGFIVHELAGDAEQESGAADGHGHQAAGPFRTAQAPPRPGPGHSRPNCAPAYYLGRPASLWISVTSPRRRSNPPRHLADATTGGPKRTPYQHAGIFDGAGSETAGVTPASV